MLHRPRLTHSKVKVGKVEKVIDFFRLGGYFINIYQGGNY